jgi:UDP-N-acetylmuramate dehydrogenase
MLVHNESMSKHCSLRAGGQAKDFFTPDTLDELSDFLKNNQKPVLMLGLGSNLLVRDQGFDGVVIKLKHLDVLNISGNSIYVEAGTTLAKLSRFCESQGLHGAEFLSAIPGSVGGALAMNAGAFGNEIWQFVDSVTTISTAGIISKRNTTDFKITYRQVIANNKNEYFIAASFTFNQIGQASCGSVFKNPINHHAARLIEDCNLKGFCIGGACVSDKHANFIVNQDNATATDIENLIKHIQQTVKSKFDINLETEVRIV